MVVGENLWSVRCQGYTSSPSEDPENKKRDGTSGFCPQKGALVLERNQSLRDAKGGKRENRIRADMGQG